MLPFLFYDIEITGAKLMFKMVWKGGLYVNDGNLYVKD